MTGTTSITARVDGAVLATSRRATDAHVRWGYRHPPHGLPRPVNAVWPHADRARSGWVRVSANSCRWIPARTWTAHQRRRSHTGRALTLVLFLIVLPVAATIALTVIIAGIPFRVIGAVAGEILVAQGWARPHSPHARLLALENNSALRLAEIRRHLGTPQPRSQPATQPPANGPAIPAPALAGEIPPWAPQHTPPTVAQQGPATVYTAPHYVRVAPPASAALRAAVARQGPVRTARIVFKALLAAGFAYALCLACLITVAADRLNDQPTTTWPTDSPALETTNP